MSLKLLLRGLLAPLVLLAALAPPVALYAADLTITATSVVPGTNAKKETGIAGEAITAGQPVYRQASSGKYFRSDADSATAEVRNVRGLALHAASLNQPLTIQTDGTITIGATVTVAGGYYLSNTPGGIMPVADLSTGEYPVLIGFATSASVIDLNIVAAGVAVP